jgi:hypothetical protein
MLVIHLIQAIHVCNCGRLPRMRALFSILPLHEACDCNAQQQLHIAGVAVGMYRNTQGILTTETRQPNLEEQFVQ